MNKPVLHRLFILTCVRDKASYVLAFSNKASTALLYEITWKQDEQSKIIPHKNSEIEDEESSAKMFEFYLKGNLCAEQERRDR